jgi:DNA helicase IV
MVILPYVSSMIFSDGEQESRQVLYVSLTRARHRLLVRVAEGLAPEDCKAMSLTA